MSKIPELDHLKVSLDHIKLATNNFADHNFLGTGGFGRVYIGQLPVPSSSGGEPAGTVKVAVKRLDEKLGQGEHQFLTEVVMLASYKHANLVTLIGFTDEGVEKIIVYKHEAHGSLDKHLENKDLTWLQRLRVCLGAARGLAYLHSGVGAGHRVLHCDIKSSNILLDENWEAKISDFGLAKIGPTNQPFTFLVTNACGTFGYVDPQYVKTGVLTKESDVYSFGVVLFEVLCGRLAFDGKYEDERRFLVGWVKHHEGSRTLDQIVFPSLREQMKPNSLKAFFRIALQCLNETKKYRPTMKSIVQELEIAIQLQTNIIGTTLWGSLAGGEPWSIRLESHLKLRKIFIDHQSFIYSIAFVIEDISNDSVHSFQQYGGAMGPSGYTISQCDPLVSYNIGHGKPCYCLAHNPNRLPLVPDKFIPFTRDISKMNLRHGVEDSFLKTKYFLTLISIACSNGYY
ncbi:hypothetical protein OSB04_011302 [Centaurea solstitialis]|uniref:Protein kinase domain-containing protein n=1 Tax=Centaurea solstitialis TaxID=347529 RepID=A0AA38TTX4_9ASTR|nr:hypothetical protein OSB04_011302 [Centaurea solstitialis]